MENLLSSLSSNQKTVISYVLVITVTLAALLILVKLINVLFRKLHKHFEENDISTSSLAVVKYILLIIIYIAAFSAIVSRIPALSSFLSTLMAGSGIVALVVSIAAQEPISNVVSGIIISVTKPFRIGDLIRYVDKDIIGYVESITLRHTVVRTYENTRLIIPNGVINKCSIENYSIADGGRFCLPIEFHITCNSDTALAMSIISDVIAKHPCFVDVRTDEEKAAGKKPVSILVTKIADSAVTIKAWCWAENSWASYNIRSDAFLELKRRFAESNIEFAYQHVKLYNTP